MGFYPRILVPNQGEGGVRPSDLPLPNPHLRWTTIFFNRGLGINGSKVKGNWESGGEPGEEVSKINKSYSSQKSEGDGYYYKCKLDYTLAKKRR